MKAVMLIGILLTMFGAYNYLLGRTCAMDGMSKRGKILFIIGMIVLVGAAVHYDYSPMFW